MIVITKSDQHGRKRPDGSMEVIDYLNAFFDLRHGREVYRRPAPRGAWRKITDDSEGVPDVDPDPAGQ